MQEAGKRMQKEISSRSNVPPGQEQQPGMAPPQSAGTDSGSSKSSGEWKVLWYLDSNGALAMAPVKVGITDGTNTEIIESPVFKAGMQVISGTGTTAKSSTKTASKSQSGPSGPPPF